MMGLICRFLGGWGLAFVAIELSGWIDGREFSDHTLAWIIVLSYIFWFFASIFGDD